MARRSNYNADGYGYAQEAEGEVLVDGLRSKVTALKSLTLDMGEEIRTQNALLKNMDNQFDSTWGMLSSSMNRVKKLASAGHNKYILYLILFSFLVFFLIYIMIRFR